MKKFITLVAIVFLVIAGLTACGKNHYLREGLNLNPDQTELRNHKSHKTKLLDGR